MIRLISLAPIAGLLFLATASIAAPSPEALVGKIDVAMADQERIATAAFFPPANVIAEIAKGIRAKLYAEDITQAQMLQVLDALSAQPLPRFQKAAVAQIRREVEAG